MKGRSHRFPSSEPHEDWVDGSWTVDCVCGVNFDDGEEMVNCDECGVWVHTRCSRYVKGEELFTCDKCKSKDSKNDAEETEVAQLLVELPMKTLRMESACATSVPVRRPFRLWTDIPMEERVHVQGVPGGDPSLFEGLSSVFTQQLWKCTGYVPKKFNFKYREFPCWDENEKGEVKNTNEIEHPADNGAGMLFSLSKENVLAAPVTALVGMRGRDEEDSCKFDLGEGEMRHPSAAMKKEKSLLRTVISSKRKKEESEAPKDRVKKNVKVADKETDEKKGVGRACKAVVKTNSDSKQLEFRKGRDPESFTNDIKSIKIEKSKVTVSQESVDGNLAVNNGQEQTSNTSMMTACSKEVAPSDDSGVIPSNKAGREDDKSGYPTRIVFQSSAMDDDACPERKDMESNHVKEVRDSKTFDTLDQNMEGSNVSVVKPSVASIDGTAQEVKDLKCDEIINNDICQSSAKRDELKKEMDNDNTRALDTIDTGIGSTHVSGTCDLNNVAAASGLLAVGPKVQSFDRTETVSDGETDKADELSSNPCKVRREAEDLEGSVSVQKEALESKHDLGSFQEPSKSSKPIPGAVASYSKRKVAVCVGKSSSNSSTIVRSSSSDNLKSADSQNSNPGLKQQPAGSNANSEKNRASSDVVRDGDRDDTLKKAFKEHPKYSASSKSSQHDRVSHASVSKRIISDSKDSLPSSSSKASSVQNVAGPGEAAGSLQNQNVAQSQNKTSQTSGLPQRGEKPNQSNSQSLSKGSTPSTHPPVVPHSSATLSDEELALLLHQELNSSPRVPRVPRMRQGGSLPQLASQAATSMLIKRTSSSGGKDHGSVFRRKNKDASKDSFHSSRDVDDKATRTRKVPSSPDRRTLDTGNRGGASSKGEENEPPRAVHSARKLLPPSSTTSTSSGPCSSNEVNDNSMPSPHNSPRNVSVDALVHRTLPGLISEIMSKGKRMTYEELCNAVLPHWPHLRKHNGERYAYSSHSQAVLDCLRNRHEWASLVDRGPKTNSSRKRRKADAEESDENESSKGRATEEAADKRLESQKEDFPKGKRKARKRRRLALQGRGIKDIRKRRKAEFSDEDGLISDSSEEESIFSDDEVQGSGACHTGGEASGSSDETENS